MRIHLSLLLGMLLGSSVPAAAQIPSVQGVQTVSMRESFAPVVSTAQIEPALSLPRAPLANTDPTLGPDHFTGAFGGTYKSGLGLDGLETLSQMREIKTLFVTRSSIPLLNLWSGRLRFDGFSSTSNTQNVQLGPSAAGGLEDFRPPRQTSSSQSRSIDRYGVSLSFHFGRGAQIGRPAQAWHSFARIIHAAR
jgi:hypothetical protein